MCGQRVFFIKTVIAVIVFLGLSGCEIDTTLIKKNATQRLKEEFPQVIIRKEGPRISQVYGTPISTGKSPEETAQSFIKRYADLFGVTPDELYRPTLFGQGVFSQPLMYDRKTGKYKFTLIKFIQQREGVPVFRAYLQLLIRNGQGFPLILAISTLKHLNDFHPKSGVIQIQVDKAQKAIATYKDHTDLLGNAIKALSGKLSDFTDPMMTIWAGTNEQKVPPKSAVAFTADNLTDPTAERPEKWLFIADFETGEILYKESLILFKDVKGSVVGNSTISSRAIHCASEQITPLPYAEVSIVGGNSTFADRLGNYRISNNDISPVTVRSQIAGQFVDVESPITTNKTILSRVAPPGPALFQHNGTNTSEYVTAQLNGYIYTNAARDWLLKVEPDYPAYPDGRIADQTNFKVRVNRTDGFCPGNAWYDQMSTNFCASSPATNYGNTANAGLIYHEYGHHIIASAGSEQGEYGEGMADALALLMIHKNEPDTSGIGYGHFYNQCDMPLRDANNNCQALPGNACSTCSSEKHTCGTTLSGAIWNVLGELKATEPDKYLDILSSLVVNSIYLHKGTALNSQIPRDFLILDDNDGVLANGTPHRIEICSGFEAHGIPCPDGMSVSPERDFTSIGSIGGPYVLGSMVFTVSNTGPDPIEYQVGYNQPWITITNESGRLAQGTSTDVVVSINSMSNLLQDGLYPDTISFINLTDHVGDTTRSVRLLIGEPLYQWNMDSDPGWDTQGSWAWGEPLGEGTEHGNPDPSSGYTGKCVYGYNLLGDYETDLPERHLTTKALDLTGHFGVVLRFYRRLNVQSSVYDHAYIRASNDGISWATIWENSGRIEDDKWSLQEFDISAIADNRPEVYLRWTMGSSDGDWQYSGWNIDDVEIWSRGDVECMTPEQCMNELYCDGIETCENNRCMSGPSVDCNDTISCTVDLCNEETDTCDHVPNNDACNDGLFCNGYEICDAHSGCQIGISPCLEIPCDETEDECGCLTNTDCSDGVYCNGLEICKDGFCSPGNPISCDDALGCTFDSCNEATDSCEHLLDHTLCDDGDDCTSDSCHPSHGCEHTQIPNCGDCIIYTSPVFVHEREGRAYGVTSQDCSSCWYSCSFPKQCEKTITTYYAKGSAENLGEDYNSTLTLYSEDDGTKWSTNQCSSSCNSNAQCRDELYCNGDEICVDGTCRDILPVNCHDNVLCTKDKCNEATDSCDHIPDDFACDDGNTCTVDTCVPDLGCQYQQIPDCRLCISFNTTLTEHEAEGRAYTQEFQDCSDCWFACRFPFGCSTNVTTYHTVGSNENLGMNANLTANLFSEDNGNGWSTVECEQHICSSDEWCDDLQYCNGRERCINGYCQSGTAEDCEDGISCTVDLCNEATNSCDHRPDDSFCNDGEFCNGVEVCDENAGCQMGNHPCPGKTCNEESDSCVYSNDK